MSSQELMPASSQPTKAARRCRRGRSATCRQGTGTCRGKSAGNRSPVQVGRRKAQRHPGDQGDQRRRRQAVGVEHEGQAHRYSRRSATIRQRPGARKRHRRAPRGRKPATATAHRERPALAIAAISGSPASPLNRRRSRPATIAAAASKGNSGTSQTSCVVAASAGNRASSQSIRHSPGGAARPATGDRGDRRTSRPNAPPRAGPRLPGAVVPGLPAAGRIEEVDRAALRVLGGQDDPPIADQFLQGGLPLVDRADDFQVLFDDTSSRIASCTSTICKGRPVRRSELAPCITPNRPAGCA
jgi:hypothetical protein